MTRAALSMVLACGLGACALPDSDDRSRYSDPHEAYTVVQPDGWTPGIVRGHTELRRNDAQHKRHTIVIHSNTRPAEITDGKATTREDVVATTTKVLRALPKASVSDARPIADTTIPATRFSLTFEPRGLATRYRREHAVLVGSKHLYHVIYTAPANEAIDEGAFTTMVSSLTEGV
jgi:hypothetical protein